MRTKTITRCMILALVMIFMTAGMAFAGVGGSAAPTVTSPVVVGQTGLDWSFTISNQSTNPNDVDNLQIDTFFFTTTCGSSSTPALVCPAGAQEPPNTITISPLTGTGAAGTVCAGINFLVTATANANEYEFTPDTNVILGPTGGLPCKVNFKVNVNAAPTHDSSASTGLQTSQLIRAEMHDTTTDEHGSVAGSSNIAISYPTNVAVVPAMDGWGMAIFILFAGLASVYYLRRRRTEG